ncbi:MAG: MBL fold metallo-hydrolase [Gammaproteobacteria bacterium]|nr:MBL fold metallo-hydrolase [Gammaproteobacteria bacterium]
MSVIKSLSVGDGDMFYINHSSDNFTIIDCCMTGDNKRYITAELKELSSSKGITRFISTHPDNDHIMGLKYLDNEIDIVNFYCVNNKAVKSEYTDDFIRYCNLRDSDKAFYIYNGCSRKWMNDSDDERGSAGISILWPKMDNLYFKNALKEAEIGRSPNNISPIIQYSLEGGVTAVWMGDLETEFLELIAGELELPKTDILFAPHHGRDSGRIPNELLKMMSPKIIVIGEAPSRHLNYYNGYNTITQNSAGDIEFDCDGSHVHVFAGNRQYRVNFLQRNNDLSSLPHYVGTMPTHAYDVKQFEELVNILCQSR